MSTQIQRRRGTTAQHAAFTGAIAETTYDTDLQRLVAHDGALAGGYPAAALHLAQTFAQSQTLANTENFFGNTTDPNNSIVFLNPAGVGTDTLDFRTNGTLNANFIRKYNTTPFQIEVAASGDLDLVVDSRNVATGTSVRFLTNGIRGSGTQTLLFTVQDNGGLVATGPLNMGTNLINNVVNPVGAQDAATKSYVDAASAATWNTSGTPSGIKLNITDATKLMRFEVDGFTAATTRVLTPPNADITLAGINIAQTFAATQTFSPVVNTSAIVSSGYSLTGANAQSLLDLAGTWNTSGTPSGIKLNITNTASNAASRLLDLRVANTVLFGVTIAGTAFGPSWSIAANGAADFALGGFSVSISAAGQVTWAGGTSSLETDGSILIDSGNLFSANVTTGLVTAPGVFQADITGVALGFFTAVGTPVTQQAVADLVNNIPSSGTANNVDDFADAVIGTDLIDVAALNTTLGVIRGDFFQLSDKLQAILAALKTYGLLA